MFGSTLLLRSHVIGLENVYDCTILYCIVYDCTLLGDERGVHVRPTVAKEKWDNAGSPRGGGGGSVGGGGWVGCTLGLSV